VEEFTVWYWTSVLFTYISGLVTPVCFKIIFEWNFTAVVIGFYLLGLLIL
jgi:hypothetical protein